MRRTAEQVTVVLGVAFVGLVALACKVPGTAPTEAADAGLAAASASTATPAPELERYSDEEAVDSAVVTIKAPTTARMSADTSSKVVGELKAGAKIVPIAVHGDYALVALGTDPGTAPKGWIGGAAILDALKPQPAAAHAKPALPTCKDAELLVRYRGSQQPSCAAQCTDDSDCKPGKCSDGLVLDGKTGVPQVANGDTHYLAVCDAASKLAVPAASGAGAGLVAPSWLVLAPGEKISGKQGKCYAVTRPVPVPDDPIRCQPMAAPAATVDFVSLPDSLDRACPVGFGIFGAYSCARSCTKDSDCHSAKGCDVKSHMCHG
ncbi:MAG TPA: hypothetical protein VF316_19390 [Polyangiaceae bacterium]